MTDFHYDPIPISPSEQLAPEVILENAVAYQDRLATRRTVRGFSDEPIDRAVIEACVLYAGTAPSGANHQPWHFACVSDPDTNRAIREAAETEEQAFYGGRAGEAWVNDLKKIGIDAFKPFLERAPWVIAVFAERYGIDETSARQKQYCVPESVGIATGFLSNAFHQLGIATLTHTPNPMKFLNQILQRPGNERPNVLLVVGRPAKSAMVPRAATVKKSLEQIATFI